MRALFIIVAVAVLKVYCETAEEYQTDILKKHNDYRRQQGGSNINKLIWNHTLALEADAWVKQCAFKHQMAGRGENLAFSTKVDVKDNIEQAFTNWYNEIHQYNYDRKRCGISCHYTQSVFKYEPAHDNTGAISRDPNQSGQPSTETRPFAGNDNSEYPYLKGPACTQCLEGQTCEDGLCAGKGKEKCEDKNKDCTMWEASGSCESNKKYMEKNCRMACGFCEGGEKGPCKDENINCAVFKKTCESNKSWMKFNCAKTCGFC